MSAINHTPLVVAPVGKWWGVFRAPFEVARREDAKDVNQPLPEVLSWHATEQEASIDASSRATFDPHNLYDPYYDRTLPSRSRKGGVKGE